MKIAYASDLHLEFGKIELKNTENADVLVLAGDITLARKPDLDFFVNTCREFPHVVYVVGNHEHYGYDFAYTTKDLKEDLGHIKNLHLLDRETFTLGDITFVGGTMWTDMNNSDSLTMWHVARGMNDFREVKNSNQMIQRKVPLYKKDDNGEYVKDEKGYLIQDGEKIKCEPSSFSPEDAVVEFNKLKDYLKIVTENSEKIVVVSHHTPSNASCHPAYAHDSLMNGAYHNRLDDFILDRPNIKLWLHGHTHNSFDYMIGSTRVVCNPRGYIGYESIANQFKLKYVEVL